MTSYGRISDFAGDNALPDEERAMLERARALVPRLAQRAPAATAARLLPVETIAEYHAAGNSAHSAAASGLGACKAGSACSRGSSRS